MEVARDEHAPRPPIVPLVVAQPAVKFHTQSSEACRRSVWAHSSGVNGRAWPGSVYFPASNRPSSAHHGSARQALVFFSRDAPSRTASGANVATIRVGSAYKPLVQMDQPMFN